ncbi:MAG: hypothetical protein ACJ76D_11900 [Solirubrobacterales bacterium]
MATPRDRAQPDARAAVAPSHCPGGHPACRETVGRIVYVERVDPDGDGDAHFVVRDPQGITLPGLTAIDVRKGLRPHPLPGPGDEISAAGPVQTGSYGQHQIHALELHVALAGSARQRGDVSAAADPGRQEEARIGSHPTITVRAAPAVSSRLQSRAVSVPSQ